MTAEKAAREPGPDRASARARRVGCGTASRRPGRRGCGARRPAEADIAQVGVMDVAGEDDDRGRRRAPTAACAISPRRSRRRSKDWLKEAQWSKSTARRSFSPARARQRSPGAVAVRARSRPRDGGSRGRGGRGPSSRSAGGRSRRRACSTTQSHSSSSTHRAPSLLEHPPGAGVDEDRPRAGRSRGRSSSACRPGRVDALRPVEQLGVGVAGCP